MGVTKLVFELLAVKVFRAHCFYASLLRTKIHIATSRYVIHQARPKEEIKASKDRFYCHAVKNKTKAIQLIKSRYCDLIANR